MRLNLYRSGGTLRYDDQGRAIWYVVDEDAPGAQKYNAVFHGSIVECARFIQRAEEGEELPQLPAEYVIVTREAREAAYWNAEAARQQPPCDHGLSCQTHGCSDDYNNGVLEAD